MVFRLVSLSGFVLLFCLTAHAGAPELPGELYRQRYPLGNATQKLIDDQGKGFAALDGTRNFRAVLAGVYYRGGANNVNHVPKRGNENPLPTNGLQNLCAEGFGHAVYLYDTNFNTAPQSEKCRTFQGDENTLRYLQISPLDYRDADLRAIHTLILDHVRDSRLGPIYAHCWNGWHASGYVAATALRQFCGFTAEQAVAYWNADTDGNDVGSGYEKIRDHIRRFQPDQRLNLTTDERSALCPQPGSLHF